MSEEDRSMIDRGLEIRRQVLGDEYVDKAMAAKTDVQAKFQDMVAGFCWGEVWGREALSLRERSLMNIVMLTALNRPHEISLHVQGALNNGLTTEEIEEAILHTMPYCGIPAAIDAMRTARPILEAATDG